MLVVIIFIYIILLPTPILFLLFFRLNTTLHYALLSRLSLSTLLIQK